MKQTNDPAMKFINTLSYFVSTYDQLNDLVSLIMKYKTEFYVSSATKKLNTTLKSYSDIRDKVQHKYFAILNKMSDRLVTEKSIKELEDKDKLTQEEEQNLQTLRDKLDSMDKMEPLKIAIQDINYITKSVSKFFNTITYKINIKTVIKDAVKIKHKFGLTTNNISDKENQNGQLQ